MPCILNLKIYKKFHIINLGSKNMNTCMGMMSTKVRMVIPLGDWGMAVGRGETDQEDMLGKIQK